MGVNACVCMYLSMLVYVYLWGGRGWRMHVCVCELDVSKRKLTGSRAERFADLLDFDH